MTISVLNESNWQARCMELSTLESKICKQLEQRNKCHGQANIYDQQTVSIFGGIEKLRDMIDELNSALSVTRPAQQHDFASLLKWKSSLKDMEEAYAKIMREFVRSTHPDRYNPLGPQQRAAWLTTASTPQNANEFLKNREQIYEQQDRGLEVLSQTISRQRELAFRLGNEVEEQNDILDNLADSMHRVETGVLRETGNVNQLHQRTGTCGYWFVIVLLFIANIIVLLL